MSKVNMHLAAANDATSHAKSSGHSSYAPYEQSRLQMAQTLGTTLDITEQLGILRDELRSQLNIAGLQFMNQAAGIDIKPARHALHSCQYQLELEGEQLGNLTLSRASRFAEAELAIIEFFLARALHPLRNALLYHTALLAAELDSMTGMRNRVAMQNSLTREIALAKRHAECLSLLVVDIDNFKNINDSFGHSAGDEILRRVAKILMDTVRETDMVFRYGGEEFVVVLSKTDLEGSLVIAERLRQLVQESAISYKKQRILVTISIGATRLAAADTLQTLFDRADEALYRAKDNGRNRVESN